MLMISDKQMYDVCGGEESCQPGLSQGTNSPLMEDWEPRELLDVVAPRLATRQASGDGVETYIA